MSEPKCKREHRSGSILTSAVARGVVVLALLSCVGREAHGGDSDWNLSPGKLMESPATLSQQPLPVSSSSESNNVAGKAAGPRRDSDVLPDFSTTGLTRAIGDNKKSWWQLLTDGGYQVPFGPTANTLKAYTATPLSYEDEHTFLGLGLGSTGVKSKSANVADHATADTDLLESGIVYRRFLNRPDAFLSPYLSAGANLQTLVSSYRNPVTAGQEAINSSSLWGMDSYTGFGLALARTNRLSIFGEADIGHTTLQPQNQQPLNSEILGNIGYLGVKAGLNLKF